MDINICNKDARILQWAALNIYSFKIVNDFSYKGHNPLEGTLVTNENAAAYLILFFSLYNAGFCNDN